MHHYLSNHHPCLGCVVVLVRFVLTAQRALATATAAAAAAAAAATATAQTQSTHGPYPCTPLIFSVLRLTPTSPPSTPYRLTQVYPREIFNAFPRVNFTAVEDYEQPELPGDEVANTEVIHFAGQYGGARAYDGQTPPVMLLQFYDLLLEHHLRFIDRLEAYAARRSNGLSDGHPDGGASTPTSTLTLTSTSAAGPIDTDAGGRVRPLATVRATLAGARRQLHSDCLRWLGGYVEGYNSHLRITVMEPPPDRPLESCQPDNGPLSELRTTLSTLLPPPPPPPLSSDAGAGAGAGAGGSGGGGGWPQFLMCVEPSWSPLTTDPQSLPLSETITTTPEVTAAAEARGGLVDSWSRLVAGVGAWEGIARAGPNPDTETSTNLQLFKAEAIILGDRRSVPLRRLADHLAAKGAVGEKAPGNGAVPLVSTDASLSVAVSACSFHAPGGAVHDGVRRAVAGVGSQRANGGGGGTGMPNQVVRFTSLAVLPRGIVTTNTNDGGRGGTARLEEAFWTQVAPMVLSCMAHIPRQTKLVLPGLADEHRRALATLDVDVSRFVPDATVNAAALYAPEVYTYHFDPPLVAQPAPPRASPPPLDHDHDHGGGGGGYGGVLSALACSQAWRVALRLRSLLPMPTSDWPSSATEPDYRTHTTTTTVSTEPPADVVVVCGGGQEQEHVGGGGRTGLWFEPADCARIVHALAGELGGLEIANSPRSQRRPSASSSTTPPRGAHAAHVVRVAAYTGSLELTDSASAAVFQEAHVIVGPDCEELLMALHSDSAHAGLQPVCSEADRVAGTWAASSVYGAGYEPHNPCVAHPAAHVVATFVPGANDAVEDGSVRASLYGQSLPFRLEFLAAAGLEVWPTTVDGGGGGAVGGAVGGIRAPKLLASAVREALAARKAALAPPAPARTQRLRGSGGGSGDWTATNPGGGDDDDDDNDQGEEALPIPPIPGLPKVKTEWAPVLNRDKFGEWMNALALPGGIGVEVGVGHADFAVQVRLGGEGVGWRGGGPFCAQRYNDDYETIIPVRERWSQIRQYY